MSKPLIAYIRVSTARQGESGLGLDAQQQAIKVYAGLVGGEVIETYSEVESGRKRDRPEFHKALNHARAAGAMLVVARLDRLVRDYRFLRDLEDSGVEFICCDNPSINRLTVRILGAVAEDEAERISKRVKDALAIAKQRGVLLGSHHPNCRNNLNAAARAKGQQMGGESMKVLAEEFKQVIRPAVAELRSQGYRGQALVDALNAKGYRTRNGKLWKIANLSNRGLLV